MTITIRASNTGKLLLKGLLNSKMIIYTERDQVSRIFPLHHISSRLCINTFD